MEGWVMIGVFWKDDAYFWVWIPEGMEPEEALRRMGVHGPFQSEAKAAEDRDAVLLGPQWCPELERLQ
jgi:hypothetical protein